MKSVVYINPYKLIGASTYDQDAVKRCKKRILSEIDLSESGRLIHQGHTLSKSDIHRIIDDLDNPEHARYHSYIAEKAALNDYLTNSTDALFEKFEFADIYKDPAFLKFIRPYFIHALDLYYEQCLIDRDAERLRVGGNNRLTKELQNTLEETERTSSFLKRTTEEYEGLAHRLDNDQVAIEQIKYGGILDAIPAECIGALPSQYEPYKNQLVRALRGLYISLYNERDDLDSAMKVLKKAKAIQSDGVLEHKLKRDHEQFSELDQEKKDLEANKETYHQRSNALLSLREINEKIKDANDTEKRGIYEEVDTAYALARTTSKENVGSAKTIDSIVLALRNISVSIWNKWSDVDKAIMILDGAIALNVNEEFKEKLDADRKKLSSMREESICFYCKKNTAIQSAVAEVSVYKITSRGVMSKKYSRMDVKVPRCQRCHTVNKNLHIVDWPIIILTVLITIACFYSSSEVLWIVLFAGGLMGFFLAAILLFVLHLVIDNIACLLIGTKKEDDIYEYSVMKNLTLEGWKIGVSPQKYE